MSKILITGATGFIGSHLTRYLLEKNYNIIAHGSTRESLEKLNDFLANQQNYQEKLDFWIQNFENETWNFPDFSDIKVIINCAAATKVREGTSAMYNKYFNLNVVAVKKLAHEALNENIEHFIHLSTGQVYGHAISYPITDFTPKNPINLYGLTKLIGELIIQSFGLLGLHYTILRPFSVYGLGHNNIISIIHEKIVKNEPLIIFGDGTQRRAFSHIDDICDALSLVINNDKCYGQDYNLSGSKEYTVMNLVELLSKKLKKKPIIEFKESDIKELHQNIAELKKIKTLGYSPSRSLEDFINHEIG